MSVKIHLQKEAVPLVRAMADEAGVSVADICEIAIYNLIAVWERDRGAGKIAVAPFDAVDGGDERG